MPCCCDCCCDTLARCDILFRRSVESSIESGALYTLFPACGKGNEGRCLRHWLSQCGFEVYISAKNSHHLVQASEPGPLLLLASTDCRDDLSKGIAKEGDMADADFGVVAGGMVG